jgi:hypothetical protein
MGEPAKVTTGGCLCGGVRFAYAGPLGGEAGAVTVCHCASCRRAQGYASAVVPALAAGFEVTQGAELIREYQSSPGKQRAFCGVCGSPLYSRREDRPEALRLRLGALDDSGELTVDAHIFTEGAPAWSVEDDAPKYPGLEPGRG